MTDLPDPRPGERWEQTYCGFGGDRTEIRVGDVVCNNRGLIQLRGPFSALQWSATVRSGQWRRLPTPIPPQPDDLTPGTSVEDADGQRAIYLPNRDDDPFWVIVDKNYFHTYLEWGQLRHPFRRISYPFEEKNS